MGVASRGERNTTRGGKASHFLQVVMEVDEDYEAVKVRNMLVVLTNLNKLYILSHWDQG